jgi:hypothetical protein
MRHFISSEGIKRRVSSEVLVSLYLQKKHNASLYLQKKIKPVMISVVKKIKHLIISSSTNEVLHYFFRKK